MKIDLKFDKDMASAVLAGRKCCTFRRKQHGEVGDTFEVQGNTYRIVQIVFMRLMEATWKFYGAEGFGSEEEMRKWMIKHYDADYDVVIFGYAHFFARVPEAGQ